MNRSVVFASSHLEIEFIFLFVELEKCLFGIPFPFVLTETIARASVSEGAERVQKNHGAHAQDNNRETSAAT